MDVGMSLWLPGGELGEYRSVKEQREMVDTVLEVGATSATRCSSRCSRGD